jgi:hypothetical protein
MADLTGSESQWPDQALDDPPYKVQEVSLGKVAGGNGVSATLTRFRVNEAANVETDTGIAVWRLHSVLTYKIGDHQYVKSRATLRMQ